MTSQPTIGPSSSRPVHDSEALSRQATAQSEGPSRDSEFIVPLPVAAGTRSPAIMPPQIEQVLSGRFRVLVVEDSKPVAEMFAMMLREMGHEVHVVSSGAAALERVRSFIPDVLFSDISMPRMDGYELARRLRQEPDLNGVFLVAMTGFDQPEDREKAFRSGFDDHIVKPAMMEDLQRLFESLATAQTR